MIMNGSDWSGTPSNFELSEGYLVEVGFIKYPPPTEVDGLAYLRVWINGHFKVGADLGTYRRVLENRKCGNTSYPTNSISRILIELPIDILEKCISFGEKITRLKAFI